MRAFFHTQASLVHDEQYANAMDGHQGYLMQYYRLTPDKRLELYQELEPSLLIYQHTDYHKSQKELQTKVKELEERNKELMDMKDDLDKIKQRLSISEKFQRV